MHRAMKVASRLALLIGALVMLLADVPSVSALEPSKLMRQRHVGGLGLGGKGSLSSHHGRRVLRATTDHRRALLQEEKATLAETTTDAAAAAADPAVETAPTDNDAVLAVHAAAVAAVNEETKEIAEEAQDVLEHVEAATKKDAAMLSEIEAQRTADAAVLDNVREEQGAMSVELVTMAKQLTRLEASIERLETYEGIRTGHKVAAPGEEGSEDGWSGTSDWFTDKTTFTAGLVQSFLVIVFIEIGDRTFFIAALMSVKHNQFIVFCGAFLALAAMTVVSTIMGVTAPLFLPRWLVHWGAVVLFLFYGVTMLFNAQFMSDQVSEELEEVEEELEEMSEKAKGKKDADKPWYEGIVSPILLQAFTLTFLAEWGDRSQIATIAMGADYNP